MEYSKQMIGIVSEDGIFMESQILKYKPTIKFSDLKEQATEHDK